MQWVQRALDESAGFKDAGTHRCAVVMDVAVSKVSRSEDIDATALQGKKKNGARNVLSAMKELLQKVQKASTHILRRKKS